jgi:hypothetical protein
MTCPGIAPSTLPLLNVLEAPRPHGSPASYALRYSHGEPLPSHATTSGVASGICEERNVAV